MDRALLHDEVIWSRSSISRILHHRGGQPTTWPWYGPLGMIPWGRRASMFWSKQKAAHVTPVQKCPAELADAPAAAREVSWGPAHTRHYHSIQSLSSSARLYLPVLWCFHDGLPYLDGAPYIYGTPGDSHESSFVTKAGGSSVAGTDTLAAASFFVSSELRQLQVQCQGHKHQWTQRLITCIRLSAPVLIGHFSQQNQ